MSDRTPVETIQAAIDRLEVLRLHGQIDFGNPLFVTLHRTIDAQLEILHDAVSRAAVDQNPAGIPIHYRHAISLAAAILGEES